MGCGVIDDRQKELSENMIPQGATLIESHKTNNFYGYWVTFKLNGECFLMYDGTKQMAITNIKCN